MTSVLAHDDDSAENQVVGDQTVSCSSQTNFQTVSLFTGSSSSFHRTNNAGTDVFVIETAFNMHTDGDLASVSASLITKTLATADVSFQLQSDTPFRYSITTSAQLPAVLPNSGYVIMSGNNQSILKMDWNSTTGNLPQGQGNLPAGVYQVEVWSFAQNEGEIDPIIQNPIVGTAGTTVTLAITPGVSTPQPAPTLRLRRGPGDTLLLQMADLHPGTFYFIEKSDALAPGLWPIVSNFIAAGTNAVWVDNIDFNQQRIFYRLRY
jgi:hypothetical protein